MHANVRDKRQRFRRRQTASVLYFTYPTQSSIRQVIVLIPVQDDARLTVYNTGGWQRPCMSHVTKTTAIFCEHLARNMTYLSLSPIAYCPQSPQATVVSASLPWQPHHQHSSLAVMYRYWQRSEMTSDFGLVR